MKLLIPLVVIAAIASASSAHASTGPFYIAANTILSEDHTETPAYTPILSVDTGTIGDRAAFCSALS